MIKHVTRILLFAMALSTVPACAPIGLRRHVRKDLYRLDEEEAAQFYEELEGVTEQILETKLWRPIFLSPFNSGNVAWMLVEAHKTIWVPGMNPLRVHAFDRNWVTIGKQEFELGSSVYWFDHKVLKVPHLEQDVLIFATRAGLDLMIDLDEDPVCATKDDLDLHLYLDQFLPKSAGHDPRERQYYAWLDDRLVLIRLEDWEGHIISKTFLPKPRPYKGQGSPEKWIGGLESSNVVQQLAMLVWLSGNPGVFLYELTEAVPGSPQTELILEKLLASENPWVREYAELVAAQIVSQ